MHRKLPSAREGFTLVEIMIVVAIIALLAAIAVPSFMRARKRSQASAILNELRQVDGAVDQWALENNKTSGDTITWSDVQGYLKAGTRLYTSNGTDLIGNPYRLQAVSSGVKVNQNTRNAFSGIGFSWGPY